jgi:hypothetical protein
VVDAYLDSIDDEYDENGEPIERREDEWDGFHIEGEAHEPLTDEDREPYDDDLWLAAWLAEWDDDEGPESTAEVEGY